MENYFLTKEELFQVRDVRQGFEELESNLLANGWETKFKSFFYDWQGKDRIAYVIRAEIYRYLWVEGCSDDGITLSEMRILLLDGNGDYHKEFSLSEDKKKVFSCYWDLEREEEARMLEEESVDYDTILCDRYHSRKDGY